MERKDNSSDKIAKGLGWLHRVVEMERKYGFFNILKGLIITFMAGYVIFFTLNPSYLLEKMEKIGSQRHDDQISQRLAYDAESRALTKVLLEKANADRAWLIELHNGTKNIASGLPFLYGDMRIEEVAEGVYNVDDQYENFSLSKYPLLCAVYDTGYIIGSVEDIKDIDERLYYKFKSNGVKDVAIICLYEGNTPLGFLGLTWCGRKMPDFDVIDWQLRKSSTKLSCILARTKKQ